MSDQLSSEGDSHRCHYQQYWTGWNRRQWMDPEREQKWMKQSKEQIKKATNNKQGLSEQMHVMNRDLILLIVWFEKGHEFRHRTNWLGMTQGINQEKYDIQASTEKGRKDEWRDKIRDKLENEKEERSGANPFGRSCAEENLSARWNASSLKEFRKWKSSKRCESETLHSTNACS